MHHQQGQAHQAQDGGSAHLLRQYQGKHHHHRRGACRYGQNLFGGGHGGKRLPRPAGKPDYPHPPGGGGREKLGFLPGDLQQKVDPYLRPLYDALFDMLGAETYQRYVERGNIEVAPLAYMRGRTLDDSFIILDEAQNTTGEQMKMFLTRLGFNSKMVITGDVTQIDLPDGKRSGLKEAVRILKGVMTSPFSALRKRMWCATSWCRISSGPMSGPAEPQNSEGLDPSMGMDKMDVNFRGDPREKEWCIEWKKFE